MTVDGKIIAAPTLLQSYMVFANTDKLKAAGITVPTGTSWSWDDFAGSREGHDDGQRVRARLGSVEPTASILSSA